MARIGRERAELLREINADATYYLLLAMLHTMTEEQQQQVRRVLTGWGAVNKSVPCQQALAAVVKQTGTFSERLNIRLALDEVRS